MRLLIFGVVCAAVVTIAVPASAASALGLLHADGITINQLEDNDWEFATGDDTIVDVGDLLIGMFEIQDVLDVYPVGSLPRDAITNGATFTGVFALKVTSKVNIGGFLQWAYTFAPVSDAEWATTGLPARSHSGTEFLVYSDSSSPFVNPDTGTIAGSLATATEGTLLWELGFRGEAGESWTALSATDDISAVGPGGLQFASYTNVTAYHAGPKLLKHDYLTPGADGIGGPLGIYSEWQIDGRRESGFIGDFDLRTDADMYILPTPEPGSLALLGLGVLGLGGVVYRRRRK